MSSSASRLEAERGRLVSASLVGAWRAGSSAPNLSEAELTEIAPLLCQTGSAALGWWRIRHSVLASPPMAGRGGSPTVREGSVTEPGAVATGSYVQPGVSSSTGREGSLTPPNAAQMLHEAYRKFRLSALIHDREIAYIFSLLRDAGIEPVLVKGWAIARLYPDRGLRPYGDIDICVRPDQFARAERALKCLENIDGHYVDLHSGFAKLELVTRPPRNLFSESRRPLRLGGEPGCQETHRRDAECAEVSQRKPFSREQAFRVPTLVGSFSVRKSPTEVGTLNGALWDELFERSRLVSLGEEKVRVLCDEDHLRILCLHLLRSGAWRPLWLCDVAVALESRASDFDWDLCLGSDPKIADWVACTIGVAHQLLGADGEEQRAKSEEPSAKERALSPLSLARAQRELPRWLVPAVLRQWGRSLNPHALQMALPALSAQMNEPAKFFAEVYARWDQPVRATVALRGRFNNWPRWPYQLGELLLHSSEVPKQLALILRERVRHPIPQVAGNRFARETGN